LPEQAVAVVLAAGIGSRFGSEVPKQFLNLSGVSVLARTVANLTWCAQVVVVYHPEHLDLTVKILEEVDPRASLSLVPGGATRRQSVSAALGVVSDLSDDVALVMQNAASPNTPAQLVAQCLDALASYDIVQAFVPATDTVFFHEGGQLLRVLPRFNLGYTADPTVFRLGCLRRIVAAQTAQASEGEMTLDTARALGIAVRLVASPESNVKLTTWNDMAALEALIESAGDEALARCDDGFAAARSRHRGRVGPSRRGAGWRPESR
jgi:2-C-methyl-D-erythritol 4-phosphate cytidylyltransferase